jgi:hypothetical protein
MRPDPHVPIALSVMPNVNMSRPALSSGQMKKPPALAPPGQTAATERNPWGNPPQTQEPTRSESSAISAETHHSPAQR